MSEPEKNSDVYDAERIFDRFPDFIREYIYRHLPSRRVE